MSAASKNRVSSLVMPSDSPVLWSEACHLSSDYRQQVQYPSFFTFTHHSPRSKGGQVGFVKTQRASKPAIRGFVVSRRYQWCFLFIIGTRTSELVIKYFSTSSCGMSLPEHLWALLVLRCKNFRERVQRRIRRGNHFHTFNVRHLNNINNITCHLLHLRNINNIIKCHLLHLIK